ncbi:MAG TPA: aldo/keto reductase [Burkholderiaceae bacterium]|nr:aldo/keto reductase [Burkholderiaceae bacterium]HQR69621.1 aldo/keto reductase [Burkholderiaceae bacterium]
MRTVSLRDGGSLPALGLGTWRFGESKRTRAAEVTAVRAALELGYRLIDTAEMYGEGGAEEVVGEAVAQALAAGDVRRDDLFIVSKVYPHHASLRGVAAACDRSRARLRLDTIDLYLLHWRGSHPLAATVDGFERLRSAGHIHQWGVSNFDLDDMQELWQLEHGPSCPANQVYYSASHRGIEFDLLPWHREHAVATMAYCPIDQGTLASNPGLARTAARHRVTAAQLALAWVLRDPTVIAIPKAGRIEHLRENLAAADLVLDADDLAALDRLFPPPRRKQPLAMS